MLKKITCSSTDLVDEYTLEVERILTALGHEEALVTDESTFGDFYSQGLLGIEEDDTDDEDLDGAMKPLGIQGFVTMDTTLVDAAKLLRQNANVPMGGWPFPNAEKP